MKMKCLQNVISCSVLPMSQSGISESGKTLITESSNVTFGDANRTLFSPSRLLEFVNFNKKDTEILTRLDKHNNQLPAASCGFIYIDLEN